MRTLPCQLMQLQLLHPMRSQIICSLEQSENRGCSISLHHSLLILFTVPFIYLLGLGSGPQTIYISRRHLTNGSFQHLLMDSPTTSSLVRMCWGGWVEVWQRYSPRSISRTCVTLSSQFCNDE